jgi:hypothetical protein
MDSDSRKSVMSRRRLLGGVAGMGAMLAGAGLKSGPAAAAPSPILPRTLTRTSVTRSGAEVTSTPFDLTHLAVSWTGQGTAPGLRLRSGTGWSDWHAVHADHRGKDGVTSNRSYALLSAPDAVGYELDGDGASDMRVVEMNTAAGPVAANTPAANLSAGGHKTGQPYLSRAAWGADESLRFKPDGTLAWGPTQYFPLQTLAVHHTVTMNDDPDPAATVRAIYNFDAVTQTFGDMGYHLLIDEAGHVYEGRWSGDDPFPVYGPTSPRQMVTGAHITGFNSGVMGVVLLGDFTSRQPTRAARTALAVVLALFSGLEVLDPLGLVNYVNPVSGVQKTVDTIAGHRDYAATECPGNTFYPELPSLRQEVAGLLAHLGLS